MALLEYGGADGLDLQLSRVLAGGLGAPTYQEGDNGPAFLGVVLFGLLAGAKRDMDGELGMNGKTFDPHQIYSHVITY